MPGLDRTIIAQVDHEGVIAHVKADIRSDFILAPHYNAIFSRAGDDLWEQLSQQLRAGTYQPDLPITMSVPKERFFTRPGSILRPADRLLYQGLVDHVMDRLDDGLDRTRSFSHVPSNESGQMFEPNHESWERFQARVAEICDRSEFILKADISNYFERLPQHHLVNLMAEAMGSEQLRVIAHELVEQMRGSVTVDWQHKASARAKMRILVKRILKRFGYPPDLEQEAVQTVLAQAELLLREIAVK